jgi:hypothetical protein
MRIGKAAATVAAASCLTFAVAACGGGGGGGPKAASGGQPSASGAPTAQAPVWKAPAGFGTGKGRAWTLTRGSYAAWAAVPGVAGVAELDGKGSGYRLTLRDALTGSVRWRSGTIHTLGTATPGLVSTIANGQAYVAVWSQGKDGSGAKAGDAYSLVIFPGNNAGDSVTGSQVVVPDASHTARPVTAGPAGLLAAVGAGEYASVAPQTGLITRYAAKKQGDPAGCGKGCGGKQVVAVTAKGALVSTAGSGGAGGAFGVPKHWKTARYGSVWSAAGGRLVAAWTTKKGGAAGKTAATWGVLDPATGKALATVACGTLPRSSAAAPASSASTAGRYVVAGPAAFDLDTHTGYCLKGAQAGTFTTVSDDGTAYAATTAGGAEKINLTKAARGTSGVVTALPAGTVLPKADLASAAIFEKGTGANRVLAVYDRTG